jgi:hypothetical protein
MADIHDLIRDWIENRGWPVHEIRLGPARCGIGRCRKKHAYARSLKPHGYGHCTVWVYERPCDINAPMGSDRVKP